LEFLYKGGDIESLPHIWAVYIVWHHILRVYRSGFEKITFLIVKFLLYFCGLIRGIYCSEKIINVKVSY
jgi:hypothetical protein